MESVDLSGSVVTFTAVMYRFLYRAARRGEAGGRAEATCVNGLHLGSQ